MSSNSISLDSVPLPVVSEHIVATPGTCGGRPRIAGHRITVDHIVLDHERGGLSPDEIASRYSGLTLADVYAALAYYHDHLSEIRALISEDDKLTSELKSLTPSRVEQKRKQPHAGNDPLPFG